MVRNGVLFLLVGLLIVIAGLIGALWATPPYDGPPPPRTTYTLELDTPGTVGDDLVRAECLRRAAEAGLTGWCP